MMNTNFTSTAKSVSKGRKVKYVVFADGVEIGSRTAGRSYAAVSVARHSYSWAVAEAKSSLDYMRKEKAKYEGWIANPEAAVAAEKTEFHRKNLAEWLKDGTAQGWVKSCEERIIKLEARIAALASMNQDSPEFAAWHVILFTNTGKLSGYGHLYNEHLVALTQPEAA